jgi:S-adenosylmethionine:tRNA ribosyltransferase-isomerase
LLGLDFDRQKIIGNYIVDFFCASIGLVIEIDDKTSHEWKENYDEKRDEYLKSLDLEVIHISAESVLKNPAAAAKYLENKIQIWLNHPAASRHSSTGGELGAAELSDKHIRDFTSYIRPGDVVVFNNSKVIPARFNATAMDGKIYELTLHTRFPSGGGVPAGRGDLANCEIENEKTWWAFAKKFGKLEIGEILILDDGTQIQVMDKNDDSGVLIQFMTDNVFDVLHRVGKMPLPPYMKREEELEDKERYQTIYADQLGSMAAPTAGLHFTQELIAAVERAGARVVNITLHVGAGTWAPIKTDDTADHKMHSEWGEITPEQADIINSAERVIAVGTTSLRLLESAAQGGTLKPFCGTTDIFITPGYKFNVVDVLLTNFHLPKSTLFMLVSAFAGLDTMKAAYAHAVLKKYRFFSYGDCCLLFKQEN